MDKDTKIYSLRPGMGNGAKFYCQNSTVSVTEDHQHEFKGHMCIAKEEVDPQCITNHTVNLNHGRVRPTRAPASRSICGFLNTGLGGTIYLGVLDNGVVVGHPLTEHRKRHFLLSVKDTLKRFSPPVSPQRVTVSFVPVLSRDELRIQESHGARIDVREDVCLTKIVGNHAPPLHCLRTYKKCWCVYNCLDEYSAGVRAQRYVVEIHVKKWSPFNPHHASVAIAPSVMRHRFYANEEGKFCYRGQGSVQTLSNVELQELTKQHDQARLRLALARRYDLLERKRASARHRARPTDYSESEHSITSSETSFEKQ